MCYVSCPEKYIFNIRLADDDLFCIVLLVARHRIDRRHRNTKTAPKEWEYSRRLKTSQVFPFSKKFNLFSFLNLCVFDQFCVAQLII